VSSRPKTNTRHRHVTLGGYAGNVRRARALAAAAGLLIGAVGCGCLTTEDVVRHAPKVEQPEQAYNHERFKRYVAEMATRQIEKACKTDPRLARLHLDDRVGGVRSWWPIRFHKDGKPDLLIYEYDFACEGTVYKYIWFASRSGKAWTWFLARKATGKPPQPKRTM